jgi:hypothetical protein
LLSGNTAVARCHQLQATGAVASCVRAAPAHPSPGAFCVSAGVIYTLDGPMVSANLRLSHHRNSVEVEEMGTKQTQQEIQQLKKELKATNKANDSRLLKLAFVLVVVAVIAGILNGRIQLW